MKTHTKPFVTYLLSTILLFVFTANSIVAAGEHFSVKEYNEFHDLLRPLQHEALPNKDFKTIRAKAVDLTTRGEAIVKVGVPAKVKDATEFQKELTKFADALVKFKADAANASDAKLEESYLAVHDTFEMLAAMLPPK